MPSLKQKLLIFVVNLIHMFPFPYFIRVDKQPYIVLPTVYTPKFLNIINLPTCQYLAHNLIVKENDMVLDFGTGTGIQAIHAASVGKQVYALDINPQAIKCAKINAILNNVSNITFWEDNIFEQIKNVKFDLIIWTPPTWLGKAEKLSEKSWLCGEEGEYIKEFCKKIHMYLNERGKIQFICNYSNDFIIREFEKNGFHIILFRKQNKFLHNSNYIYLAYR